MIESNTQPEHNVESHHHKRFPEKLAFILDNPIRRLLHPPERLISQLGISSKDVVVDFGCGPGFFLIPIAKLARKAVGVDVSPGMLERATRRARKEHLSVELIRSDGTGIELPDESVDMILLNHVFHEVEDKPRVLKEFRRILVPSGRLVIVERTHGGSNLLGLGGPPVIDESELASEIENDGFKLTRTIAFGESSIAISQKTMP